MIENKIEQPSTMIVDRGLHAPEVMNTVQAAAYLGISRQYLEIARHKGNGPQYVKLARLVRYRKTDLETWLAKHLCQNTSQAAIG